MRHPALTGLVLILLAGCTSASGENGWTGSGREPFETARTACQQISYGIEENFIRCMAGRGWIRSREPGRSSGAS